MQRIKFGRVKSLWFPYLYLRVYGWGLKLQELYVEVQNVWHSLPFWKQDTKHVCHIPLWKAPNSAEVIECKLFKWLWSPWGAEVVLQGADYRGCSYTTRGRALLKGASLAGAARELTFELTYIIHVPFISCYPYFVLCLILVPAAKFPGVFQVQMIKWYLKHICSYLTFANNFIHFSTLILIFPMVKLWELLWLFYHHKECSKFFLFHWSSEIISTFLNPKSYF